MDEGDCPELTPEEPNMDDYTPLVFTVNVRVFALKLVIMTKAM